MMNNSIDHKKHRTYIQPTFLQAKTSFAHPASLCSLPWKGWPCASKTGMCKEMSLQSCSLHCCEWGSIFSQMLYVHTLEYMWVEAPLGGTVQEGEPQSSHVVIKEFTALKQGAFVSYCSQQSASLQKVESCNKYRVKFTQLLWSLEMAACVSFLSIARQIFKADARHRFHVSACHWKWPPKQVYCTSPHLNIVCGTLLAGSQPKHLATSGMV